MKIITLTTDFGVGDFEIGTLYGVIWSLAPQARVIDFTHGVMRHNIMQASLNLGAYTPYFPEGSIHVAVVDPGVGTTRRPIAAALGDQFFVGPDNGLLTEMRRHAQNAGKTVQIVHLDRPQFWLPKVSNVFHGRDIFSPAAAHLANGIPLIELGTLIEDPVLLDLPQPRRAGSSLHGQIILVDHFGNLGTNIEREHLMGMGKVQVRVGGVLIDSLVKTFGECLPGDLIALISGSNHLAISVVNGSAAQRLQVKTGDPVEVLAAE